MFLYFNFPAAHPELVEGKARELLLWIYVAFYIYILKCKDGSYYTVHTDDIEKRISEHKHGLIESCYTKKRRPIEVVYIETFGSRDEAFDAERQIKGWSRKKKEALINRDWNEIKKINASQKMSR